MNNENSNLINNIALSMTVHLADDQMQRLKDNLAIILGNYEVHLRKDELLPQENTNAYIFAEFLKGKAVDGCLSKASIRAYTYRIKDFFKQCPKPVTSITSDDIRTYLAKCGYNANGELKKRSSMNNIYHILGSYFSWLLANEYISKNPIAKIAPFKIKKAVRKPFTEEEITMLRDSANDIRDLAIIDLLNSSMCRVGEIAKLNRDDISFTSKETVVIGKGDKERTVYFDGQTKEHLQAYLATRTDDNPALFISKKRGTRLNVRGYEVLLHRLGDAAGVDDTHPHRFRRTGATRCIRSGVPIDVVQRMLGHTNIATTQIYVSSTESTIKHFYQQVYND